MVQRSNIELSKESKANSLKGLGVILRDLAPNTGRGHSDKNSTVTRISHRTVKVISQAKSHLKKVPQFQT